MSIEYIVSGCLAGLKCRYDGNSKPVEAIVQLVANGRAIPVCPESLSGLPVPRLPCEQQGGKIICQNGQDFTKEFYDGAQKALELALRHNCKKAILKANSPSCGINRIYDGSFSGKLVAGMGIFAQMLKNAGFELEDEQEWK